MARLIRPLSKSGLSFPSYLSSSSSSSRTLILQLQHQQQHSSPCAVQKPNLFLFQTSRSYISDMRKSAFEGNILRLLRNEIQHELESSPPNRPIGQYGEFSVDAQPGEQWIILQRKYGKKEDIKIEVSMFDGAISASKSGGGGATAEDVHLHISFIVNISKGVGSDGLEIMCSAWPDSIEINRLFIRRGEKTPAQSYAGPEFKELDDELQDSLYEFLEARGVDDELAVFLHEYMRNKDKTEFVRWVGIVKAFIEKK